MALFLLDSGGYTIKSGFSTSPPSLRYNCVGKMKRSSVVTHCPLSLRGFHEVCRAVERGVIVDPQLQSKIWGKVFKQVTPSETSLVMSLPIYTPKTVLRWVDEIVFEHFGFTRFARRSTGVKGTVLLLDLGFSGSTVIPVIDGFPINYATKRVSVGGKLITNYLKREISFRHYDMTDETWLVSDIKEKVCRVSTDFLGEMRRMQDGKIPPVNYVLPESQHEDGHVQASDEDISTKQVLSLNNLCITPSELLFTPSDISLHEAGIAQAILESISCLDSHTHSELLQNIVVTGGSAMFKGLKERL